MVLDKEIVELIFWKTLIWKSCERRMTYERQFKKENEGEIESAGIY
jgi:hypothetical protein